LNDGEDTKNETREKGMKKKKKKKKKKDWRGQLRGKALLNVRRGKKERGHRVGTPLRLGGV